MLCSIVLHRAHYDYPQYGIYTCDFMLIYVEWRCCYFSRHITRQYWTYHDDSSFDMTLWRIIYIVTRYDLTRFCCTLNQSGQTPLMFAASRGHMPVVKLLLENDADANLADDVSHQRAIINIIPWMHSFWLGYGHIMQQSGQTALLVAALGGHEEAVRWILKAKANVNHADNVRQTLFCWVSFRWRVYVIFCYLVWYYILCIVRCCNQNGTTALILAANWWHLYDTILMPIWYLIITVTRFYC